MFILLSVWIIYITLLNVLFYFTSSTQNLNILVVGATFVGIKLCKKLVSSKVKSVTLLCEYETEQEDVDSLFTLSHSDFGTEVKIKIVLYIIQLHVTNKITRKNLFFSRLFW